MTTNAVPQILASEWCRCNLQSHTVLCCSLTQMEPQALSYICPYVVLFFSASSNISPSPFSVLCLPISLATRQSGAFKRNFSSPLLTIDPLGVVREAPAAQGE